jgi:hypothetical protein
MSAPWYRPAKILVWALFLVGACSILARCAYEVLVDGRIWSGAFGYTADVMQYLAFVRESSEHVLIGNSFAPQTDNRAFLNPVIAISGFLARAGVPIPWAFAIWVPLGAVCLAWGTTRVVEAAFPESQPGKRIIALALGLGYAFRPDLVMNLDLAPAKRLSLVAAEGDAWPMKLMFGWPLGALSVGLMAAVFAAYWKRRSASDPSGTPWLLIAGGFLCAWIQPWPGITLIGAVLVAELAARVPRVMTKGSVSPVGLLTPALIIGAAAVPVAYYAVLDRLDPGWHLSGVQLVALNKGAPWWVLVVPMAPLLVGAAFALLLPTRDMRWTTLVSWATVALSGAVLIQVTEVGNMPQHMIRGLAIPLAVLSVLGVGWATRNWTNSAQASVALIALLALVVVPGLTRLRTEMRDSVDPGTNRFLNPGEDAALAWIAKDAGSGEVVAAGPIAAMVPWRTGRLPWAAHRNLTPDFPGRSADQWQYLYGVGRGSSAAATQNFFGSNHFALILLPCRFSPAAKKSLTLRLGPLIKSEEKFGCASVLTLKK